MKVNIDAVTKCVSLQTKTVLFILFVSYALIFPQHSPAGPFLILSWPSPSGSQPGSSSPPHSALYGTPTFSWTQNFCIVNLGIKNLRINLIPLRYPATVIPCRDNFNWGIKFKSAHNGYRNQAFKINTINTKVLIIYLQYIFSTIYIIRPVPITILTMASP